MSRGLPDVARLTVYEIEHNVPIPPAGQTRRSPPTYDPGKYQWERLEPGDSFVVPAAGADEQVATRMRLLASAKRYGDRRGKTFTTRLDARGVRIWRVT